MPLPTVDRRGTAPRAGRGVRPLLAAAAVAALYLLCVLPRLADFGPTWDLALADYPYGEQYLGYVTSGDRALIDFDRLPPAPPARAPHPDFASGGRSAPDIAYPLGGMLSALGCRVLWTWAGVVPAMAAHHVVVPLCTALLLAALVLLGARWRSLSAGVGAAALAALSPYFLAHSAFNVKDVPETCLYTATYVALAAALLAPPARGAALRTWLLVGVLFGLALAQKPNALFLPVQGLLLWIALRVGRGGAGPRFPWRGALLVLLVFPLAYLAVSPYEWTDTWERLLHHWQLVVGDGTTLVGSDRLLGLKYVLWTTPLPVLVLAGYGLFDRRLAREPRAVLLVGLGLPLLRTLLPIRIHDGPRHFLEFFPMLCLWAGIGLAGLLDGCARFAAGGQSLARGTLAAMTWALALLPGALAVRDTWPHGTCYFNALVGGLKGAQAAGVPDATDGWCGSYWQGLQWLSEHAEPHASVLVPVGNHVALCAAPLRLRADLSLWHEGGPPPSAPLYVMAVTRGGMHAAFVEEVARGRSPVHEIRVQGAPILVIRRIDDPAEVARLFALFDATCNQPLRRLLPALAGVSHLRPELLTDVQSALQSGDEAALGRAVQALRAELPGPARAALDKVLAGLPAPLGPAPLSR